jgi:hypothetical protein
MLISGIEVCGRTFPIIDANNKQSDVVIDCLWSTVKQYKLIVDYCLFKVFKLYAKVGVKHVCRERNRSGEYLGLLSNISNRF